MNEQQGLIVRGPHKPWQSVLIIPYPGPQQATKLLRPQVRPVDGASISCRKESSVTITYLCFLLGAFGSGSAGSPEPEQVLFLLTSSQVTKSRASGPGASLLLLDSLLLGVFICWSFGHNCQLSLFPCIAAFMSFVFRGSVKILSISCSPSLMLHSLLTTFPTSPQLLHLTTPHLSQSNLRNEATAEAPGALRSPVRMATSSLWGFFWVQVSNVLKIVASARAGDQAPWPIITIVAACQAHTVPSKVSGPLCTLVLLIAVTAVTAVLVGYLLCCLQIS